MGLVAILFYASSFEAVKLDSKPRNPVRCVTLRYGKFDLVGLRRYGSVGTHVTIIYQHSTVLTHNTTNEQYSH